MATGRVHPSHPPRDRAVQRRERIRTWVPARVERQIDGAPSGAPDSGRAGHVVRGED